MQFNVSIHFFESSNGFILNNFDFDQKKFVFDESKRQAKLGVATSIKIVYWIYILYIDRTLITIKNMNVYTANRSV